ncbi:hypothetical protein BDD12DRAFT_284713 [Trichophaea hybrida]|nr:hypothetical protein BDD12DRAFT_284713 [Trichophaea hybrida]
MAIMGPMLSWAVFLSVIGAVYYVSQRKTPSPGGKKHVPLQEKPKSVFVSTLGSGTETGDVKKKTKKKAKKSTTVAKEVVSTDDGGNKSDDDVAEEVDLRDVARRLKTGEGAKLGASRKGGNLAPSPYAASQTSSAGADGDIDEEEAAPLTQSDYLPKSSSTDPSDMLEAPTGGPGVLRIGAPTQLPRGQKKKAVASTPEAGVHANKNAKKKEKKKAEREIERADQQARFEQHRKAMRAEEAAQQKSRPNQVESPAASTWTQVGAKKAPAVPVAPAPSVPASSTALLDTFTPDSDNEKIQQSTTLGDSWESIPPGVMVPEPEWNQVKKKTRGAKKAEDTDAGKSSDEASRPKPVPTPEPVKQPKAPKPVQKKVSNNNFGVLDTTSDARTASGSDWAEVDNENWAVHPESSDY